MNAVENAPQSQVEVTCKLVEIAAQMPDVRTPADLGLLRDALLAHLTFRSYNKASWEHERSIRWKRTATEILSDGWVYEAKGCTDIVIAFIGLCRAKGLATRFVKVRSDTGKQHALAEVYHSGAWWLVETVVPGMAPIEGEMKEETQYKIWRLWRKGLDSWSIGLKEAQRLKEIFAVAKMIIFDYGRTLYDRETDDFFPDAISVVKTLAEKYRLSIVSVSPADEEETRIELLKILDQACHFQRGQCV